MVSMKDIAKRCGVSVATVSKALNGQPDIGEETRRRVCDTAAELGYMTNSAARALKTNRTYNLGILFVDERRSGLSHEYFSTVLEGFKSEAEAHGYDITFISNNVGGKRTGYLQHCMYRGVDGIVIACVDFLDSKVRELVDARIPVVTIDHIFEGRTAVVSDNFAGVRALVRHVYDKGHRKIAFLHGERTTVTQNRLRGFRETCRELGLQIPDEYVIECAYHDPDRCAEGTLRLLALEDRPTCVLFPDDFSYIGGARVLRDMGLQVPEDISAVGYDGIHLSKVIGLTTFSQDARTLGKTAAERLIGLIERPGEAEAETVMIPGSLSEGTTVKQL